MTGQDQLSVSLKLLDLLQECRRCQTDQTNLVAARSPNQQIVRGCAICTDSVIIQTRQIRCQFLVSSIAFGLQPTYDVCL